MGEKKWFVVKTVGHGCEDVVPISKLFDDLGDAKAFYEQCHKEDETEYFICETVYG